MNNSSKLLTDLSPVKRRLLLQRLQKQKENQTEEINRRQLHQRATRKDSIPLSFAQQRLWFLTQLEPDNTFYNITAAVRLSGKLDISALGQALNALIQRHESLRTTFNDVDGQPVQCMAPNLELPLLLNDLSDLSEQEQARSLEELMAEEAGRTFNLAQGPLLRVRLLRLAETEHLAFLSMHHIIGDGWSTSVLLRDLSLLYEAFTKNLPPSLPELTIQYADFALWQREWLQGERLEAQLDYWRKQLAGLPEIIALPTDKPRPPMPSYRGRRQGFQLSPVLTEALRALGRQSGATLFMTLLAAFQTLLFRYTHQTDIVVGTPVAGRNRTQTEELIGFFVNTLLMRARSAAELSFRQMLEHVREVALGAYTHQDLPFERLIEELRPARHLTYQPIFQVMFALQNTPELQLKLAGLTLSLLKQENTTSKFDLFMELTETSDGLRGRVEYSDDLFEAATITGLINHFQTLLENVSTRPEQSLIDIPLLSEFEWQQILVTWNRTATEYPETSFIHRLFEEQTRRTPDAIAVIHQDYHLTYRELNHHADKLAGRLNKLGVNAEVTVGLCVERSVEMVVALLGILKAGGIYIPLDPHSPAQRLAYMLADIHAHLLLTQESFSERLSELGVLPVCLDGRQLPIETISQDDVGRPNEISNDQLAYLIYTSGSTGRPKGVGISHRNVVKLVKETDYVDLSPQDVFLQAAPMTFDASTFEVWGCLLNGAKLVLSPAHKSSLEELGQTIRDHQVSVLWLTAALFRQMVDSQIESLQCVRLLLAGGESLSVLHVQTAIQRLPNTKLINGYGPTETTTFACCHPVTALSNTVASIPIGRPISNTEAYILDQGGQPVPIGVTGELYIGGDGVGRWYFDQPALTAEKFVPHPFTTLPGARLYRTGDLARYLRDGTIQFLGRCDRQVKLRGFRIELAEIEAALSEYPAVKESVIAVREDVAGDKRLVAYVVPQPQAESAAEHVSQWQTVFGDLYSQGEATDDPTFNIIGWESTYTGLPIPAEQMRSWLDDTTERILSLRPQRVLEIGCGSGLLLFRLAPHCTHYLGTDFSAESVRSLRQKLSRPELKMSEVTLQQQAADDFTGIEPGAFDTVILNSVVQYFPDVDYLLSALEGALKAISPSGTIFIGDVRSLPLLELFHTATQFERAEAALSLVQLRERIKTAIAKEGELLLDPALFLAVKRRFPQISQVAVYLKHGPKCGSYHNELTQFRYQVVIRAGAESDQTIEADWLDYDAGELDLQKIRRILSEDKPSLLGVTRVPNARLARPQQIIELLANTSPSATVGEVKEMLARAEKDGVEPDELSALAEELPYEVQISWGGHQAEGSFDVLFERRSADSMHTVSRPVNWPQEQRPLSTSWNAYANAPQSEASNRRLIPELRRHLEQRLPDYMMPAAFVALSKLPVTTNGKIDHRALPAPDQARSELAAAFVAPRDGSEMKLANIWSEILRVEPIGINDNFFELGGHSLLATQVISRVREAFEVELPLRALFEHPTVAQLGAEIENHKRDSAVTSQLPLAPVSRECELPLSFTQQELWFLDQLIPGNTAYNISTALRLTGTLNFAAVELTLSAIVGRHESLRTTFATTDGRAGQRISRPQPVKVRVIDVCTLAAVEREAETRRLASWESQQPFDLARGPLFRATLFKLAEQEHVLLLMMHHIVSDGWSMGVLAKEAAVFYEAALRGRELRLPELPIQYADFAVWQRERLQGAAFEEQLTSWEKELAGAPTTLDLPTDYPRPPVASLCGANETLTLNQRLSEALKELGRQQGATLFMTLLAAFQTLLTRYSGQDQVCIGTPTANRRRSELEGLIGCFVNTLVLRGDLRNDPSFSELLQRTRETTLQAFARQEIPLEILVERLRLERTLSRSPLFQVMFNLLNFGQNQISLPGLQVSSFPLAEYAAKFDLTLYAGEDDGQIRLTLAYATDLFERATMTQMLRRFRTLLEQIAEHPSWRLSTLTLLTPKERAELCAAGQKNAARVTTPFVEFSRAEIEQSITQRFAEQARRHPARLAVKTPSHHLSYRELQAQAQHIARALLQHSSRQDERVALLCEHDSPMIAAILGVLSAGKTYVPIAPHDPREWAVHTLQDAQATLLLADERNLATAGTMQLPVIRIEPLIESSGDDAAELPVLASPDSPAYLLYTSGTTGPPKGVVQNHRNVLHHIRSYTNQLHLNLDDKLTLFSAYGFDAAVMDIFGALLNGAAIYPIDLRDDGFTNLPAYLSHERISVFHATPTVYRQFVNSLTGSEDLSAIRLVVLGGERASARDGLLFQRHFSPNCVLINGLGLTESTLALQHFVNHETRISGQSLPVGFPVTDTEVFLWNQADEEVEVYNTGEIVISSAHLALGYWRQPALTAAAFLPDPRHSGRRCYRTGDLGRLLPDGRIEFIARKDLQIKIRGHRVEMKAIESVLNAHPAVRDCVVTACDSEVGEKQLVAYVVAKPDTGAPGPELLTWLRQKLPAYMLPTAIIPLEQWPLMANGKLDRRALPSPLQALMPATETFVAPRTLCEEGLAELWRELLQVERIGAQDNFFDLGGHSLLATRLMTRVHEVFGVELPLRSIFESPMLAELAAAIEQRQSND